jgi:hypothetical protein
MFIRYETEATSMTGTSVYVLEDARSDNVLPSCLRRSRPVNVSNLTAHAVFHLTVNSNGQVTSDLDNFRIQCS